MEIRLLNRAVTFAALGSLLLGIHTQALASTPSACLPVLLLASPAASDFIGGDEPWLRVTSSIRINTPPLDCLNECTGPSPDADGDGLTACEEACYATNDALLDSDADGMPDSFETDFGLDPLSEDAQEDPDIDGLSNLEEFLARSSPVDPNSPFRTFHVAPDGTDTAKAGGLETPWASIAFAIQQSGATPDNPARILLADGLYNENVALVPGVHLRGLGGAAVIVGAVAGADATDLSNLEIRAGAAESVLLEMNDVTMHLSRVVFRGDTARTATGILVDGTAPCDSVIENCTFTSLRTGLDVAASIPLIRRCTFTDLIIGIILRGPDAAFPCHTLGDPADRDSGWNTFDLGTITGRAIINERSQPVFAQNNDWGTNDPNVIKSSVEGEVAVEPFLPAGSALFAAALFCTVWESTTREPILDATIDLQVAPYPLLTGSEAGLYSYPALAEGDYELTITAPDHTGRQVDIDIPAGSVQSITVALQAFSDDDGPRRCFLRRPRATTIEDAGDALMLALLGLSLLATSRWFGHAA
ncbi:MAG: carboxypeptidase regulatory-like domain-containing protein [Candidatus Hydrogenedentes bacterium]|nr:carboxypeptidase regulatory-like domain-containing protein [Candidatus Hydrogenedentota bacterium]